MPDADGYPTDEELAKIRDWPYTDPAGWFEFIKSCWWAADWGWKQKGDIYHISTAGWSGNEQIIEEAMMANRVLWAFTWEESRRGGHYKFTVKRLARHEEGA